MRPSLALTLMIALALLLPAAAEAGMRSGGRINVFRAPHVRHAQIRHFRSPRRATNLAPFLGSDFIDDGIDGQVADAGTPDAPFPASLGRLPRRLGNERATVDVEHGVTVIRGPGSRHILP
ncbi:MAG TPA: hypothetical protein VLX85_09020 [Stellaceae bacterium]|nr:hypothetical protein [Stellaceae bacterium]